MGTGDPCLPTVFVVDDDPDVCVGLDRLLRASGWLVKIYTSASDFLERPPAGHHGCVLLDVNLPGMSGPELHERIRERGIAHPVVYLTGDCTLSTGVRAMKAGALDLLEKPVDEAELLRVVEDAIARDAERLASTAHLDAMRGRLARLSPREREVMDHVVAGRLNKQIASELGIAEKTVKVHRGRAMAKMEVRSVAQLVHLCHELAAPAQH